MSADEIDALRTELRTAIDKLRDALTEQVGKLIKEIAEITKKQAVADAMAAVAEKQLCKFPNACVELIPRVDALEEQVASLRQIHAVESAERHAERKATIRILTVLAALGQALTVITGLALQYFSK